MSEAPAYVETEVVEPKNPFWHAVDARLASWGDRLNPILVKETRQALKSRQFVITFALVLLASCGWTIYGVSIYAPKIYYGAQGADMLLGYYWILALPLSLIVPLTAYRSLCAELDENTFDVLSISTLSARRIVSGKLGSAALQLMVYTSAVAPCIAFTYLLRGIDVVLIVMVLGYTLGGSLCLTIIALMLATLTRNRFGQLLITVALVIGLFVTFILSAAFTDEMVDGGFPWGQWEFRFFLSLVLCLAVCYFVLCFLGAAARLGFVAENTSTPLRIAMLLPQFCVIGFVATYWLIEDREEDMITGCAVFLLIHWYVMGILMSGEKPELSRRVQRSLPVSLLGRMFFTWLASFGSVVLIGSVAALFADSWDENIWVILVLGLAYLTIYLGMGTALVRAVGHKLEVEPLLGGVLQIVLLMFFTLGAVLIHALPIFGFAQQYSWIELPNPFWTLSEIGGGSRWPAYTEVMLVVCPAMALAVFATQVPFIRAAVHHQRIALPQRVSEDDAANLPVVEPVPESPWD